jgi:hypothetical protein
MCREFRVGGLAAHVRPSSRSPAEGDGLFTCTIVGEPTAWFVPYENYPRGYYRAAVDMGLHLTSLRAA